MTFMSPPIITIPPHIEPPRCPDCGKVESTELVCAHCGYVYPKSSWRWYDYLWGVPLIGVIVIVGIVIFMAVMAFVFVPIMEWMFKWQWR